MWIVDIHIFIFFALWHFSKLIWLPICYWILKEIFFFKVSLFSQHKVKCEYGQGHPFLNFQRLGRKWQYWNVKNYVQAKIGRTIVVKQCCRQQNIWWNAVLYCKMVEKYIPCYFGHHLQVHISQQGWQIWKKKLNKNYSNSSWIIGKISMLVRKLTSTLNRARQLDQFHEFDF